MSKRISILGSTGSIGTQSLEVIEACGMEVAAMTAIMKAMGKNIIKSLRIFPIFILIIIILKSI